MEYVVVVGTAKVHGCNATVEFSPSGKVSYPPTTSNEQAHELVKKVAIALVGEDKYLKHITSMGAEDFSFIAEKVPSAYSFIGMRNETAGSVHGLHSPFFVLDEGVMEIGARLHIETALAYLKNPFASTTDTVSAITTTMNKKNKNEL